MSRARGVQLMIACGALILASACVLPEELEPDHRADARPDLLWLPDGARIESGPSSDMDGTSVVFQIPTSDHDAVSNGVIKHFADAGWSQRSTERSIPSIETSFRAGWRRAEGGIGRRGVGGAPSEVRKWTGEWENDAGDLITYVLLASQYADSERDSVRGLASHFPRY